MDRWSRLSLCRVSVSSWDFLVFSIFPTTFLTLNTSSFFAQNVFSKIADYAVASTASAAFIIGGYDAVDVFSTLSTVAEFSQLPSELAGSWKRRGDLQRARADHKAITYLGQTFVIGSWPYPRFVSEWKPSWCPVLHNQLILFWCSLKLKLYTKLMVLPQKIY